MGALDEQPAAVDVLVDDSGRLGPLSYLLPGTVTVAPGDAVTVPFGRSVRHGLVLGPSSDPSRAVKEITCRLGSRVDPAEMTLAAEIVDRHFSTLAQVAARLSPRKGRGADPLDAGTLQLTAGADDLALPEPEPGRRVGRSRLYLRPPLADPARIAALEAHRLAARGQVLVLCPTVRLLERVLAEFAGGAARLDSKARSGAWGAWRSGQLPVGIGTRTAALYSADDLAGIVVVEEDHPGHVESTVPYTNARDLAVRRAELHRCALTLISASPSAAGVGAGKVLTFPSPGRLWPQVSVFDRSTVRPGDRDLPPQVTAGLNRSRLPVTVLTDGRPPRRLCTRCSASAPCPCGTVPCEHPPAGPCAKCGSCGFRWVGWNAARIAARVPAAVPVTVAELAALAPADRVVAVIDVDGLLNAPAFDGFGGAVAVLVRAAEAAGPRGRLVIVTSQSDHPLLRALRTRDLLPVVRQVWANAKRLSLPPFGRLVTVRMDRAAAPKVATWPGRVHGPRRRDGEWEVLVQVTDDELPALAEALAPQRRRGRIRITVT